MRVRGHDATHYPLSLIVQPGERLRCGSTIGRDLFDRGSVRSLGERLVRLLTAAVARPERRDRVACDRCRRPSARTLLEGFNATARPVAGQSLPALFAAQAGRTPDAVAVVCGERTLSYAALEAHVQPAGASPARRWGWGRRRWWGSASSARRRW